MSKRAGIAVGTYSVVVFLAFSTVGFWTGMPRWGICLVIMTSLIPASTLSILLLVVSSSESRIKKILVKSRTDASRHEYLQEKLLEVISRTSESISADVEGLVWASEAPDESNRLNFSKTGRIDSKRILLVTSNGAGMGHLTRLMAIAKCMKYDVAFVSLSTAAAVVRELGFDFKYFESQMTSGLEWPMWNRKFAQFIDSVIRVNNVDAVIFDGTWIYRGVHESCRRNGIPLIWCRRGLWKPEADMRQVTKIHAVCDLVISPGDVGDPYDNGPLAGITADFVVDPIVIVNRKDVLVADEARLELGLSAGKRYILVQMGAGNINDIQPDLVAALDAISDLGSDWEAVIANSPLSPPNLIEGRAVRSIQKYPIARYLSAFEFGIFAAGYNTVHESIVARLPSVFVPNIFTVTDNQVLRAEAVARLGMGLVATTRLELAESIAAMAEDELRNKTWDALDVNGNWSGGEQFAAVLAEFLD